MEGTESGLIADDIVLLDLWDRAVQRQGVNEYGCKGKPEENGVDNVHDIQEERPSGTSANAALRRLRKDRPED